MEILVSINCTDKTIDLPLTKLMNYDYFKMALSNFSTKITCEKIDHVDSNGIIKPSRVYTIPCLTLDCNSKILIRLLSGGDVWINLDNYESSLPDLIYFNGLYETKVKFKHAQYEYCSHGREMIYRYRSPTYVKFLEFVKSHFPRCNVYDLLDQSGFDKREWNFFSHSCNLLHYDKFPKELLVDLIDRINDRLENFMKNKYVCDDISDFIHSCSNNFEKQTTFKQHYEYLISNYCTNKVSLLEKYPELIDTLINDTKFYHCKKLII